MITDDIRQLLSCIEIYIKTSVLASACGRDLVYLYQQENEMSRLTIYHNHLLPDVPEVDPGFDWHVKNKLWFRKNLVQSEREKCFFEPLIAYLPEYVPVVTVNTSNPLASVLTKLPFAPHQSFISTQPQGVRL